LVVALAGCGEQKAAQDNGGWVATSAALQAHGVYAVRVAGDAADPGVQVVGLRGQAQESVGKLSLRQVEQGGSVTLEFRGETWIQSFEGGAQGKMVMTLDGSAGTFVFDGSAWQGDANAQSVMTRSASLIELAKLIGAEVGLTLSAPAATTTTTTTTTPAPTTTPEPTPAGPALNCTDAVVYAQGQALFFEPDGQACKNAQLALALECKVSTTTLTTPNGLACCNVPSNPTCFNCVDLGFIKQCSVYGYLQQVN
jgi:hypothetical protein